MTLTDFLLACIADDEAVARAAVLLDGHWRPSHYGDLDLLTVSEEVGLDEIAVTTWLRDGSLSADEVADPPVNQFTHIARHDPARVLAECEAKRKIVERAIRASQAFDQSINPTTSGVAMTMDLVLADLALPYADRPDYQEAWKP